MSQASVVNAGAEVALQDWQAVAQLIDHTLLRPEATRQQIVELCQQAVRYRFATVCVQPCWGALAASLVRGTEVGVDLPIGFPQGAVLTSVKRYEAAEAVKIGATELDMVINVGMLKSGEHAYVENDIAAVAEIVHGSGAMLKVILETTLLGREEKKVACELAVAAGADFVKTSTGLVGGATVEDVQLMRSVVGDRCGVKASGGIRNAAELSAMVAAGANRIGTSAGAQIVRSLGAPE
jgi:deoxyribose-phosphate aldolase